MKMKRRLCRRRKDAGTVSHTGEETYETSVLINDRKSLYTHFLENSRESTTAVK